MAILAAPDGEPLPSLEALSLEVARIAAQLALLADREAFAAATGTKGDATPAINARIVRAAIRIRQMRPVCFGLALTNPGWSMMLELYACRLEHRPMPLKRIAAQTGIAPTTALRWIEVLAGQGLIVRCKHGPRNVCIELTEDGAARMAGYWTAGMEGARGR